MENETSESLKSINSNKKFTVLITSDVYKQLTEIITKPSNIERVGAGFGKFHDSFVEMLTFIQIENLDNAESSFSIDYEILLRKIQDQEKLGNSLIGFFHTHPEKAPIYPSKKDQRYMRFWPYPYIWLIGGNRKYPDLKIFSLYNKKLIELPYNLPQT